jgi:hypothetical protein
MMVTVFIVALAALAIKVVAPKEAKAQFALQLTNSPHLQANAIDSTPQLVIPATLYELQIFRADHAKFREGSQRNGRCGSRWPGY